MQMNTQTSTWLADPAQYELFPPHLRLFPDKGAAEDTNGSTTPDAAASQLRTTQTPKALTEPDGN